MYGCVGEATQCVCSPVPSQGATAAAGKEMINAFDGKICVQINQIHGGKNVIMEKS